MNRRIYWIFKTYVNIPILVRITKIKFNYWTLSSFPMGIRKKGWITRIGPRDITYTIHFPAANITNHKIYNPSTTAFLNGFWGIHDLPGKEGQRLCSLGQPVRHHRRPYPKGKRSYGTGIGNGVTNMTSLLKSSYVLLAILEYSRFQLNRYLRLFPVYLPDYIISSYFLFFLVKKDTFLHSGLHRGYFGL